jgi:hypothetical protein
MYGEANELGVAGNVTGLPRLVFASKKETDVGRQIFVPVSSNKRSVVWFG